MLTRTITTIAMAAALAGSAMAQDKAAAKDQHTAIGAAEAKAPNTAIFQDPARKWFPQAGLGLFIHWGISSVSGQHDLSWGMMNHFPWTKHPLTPEAYWALADRFDPQDYHPEKWLQAAKEAGFGYAVLTARHHDGYALWPSQYGDFSTRTKLGGRDLLRPYVEACRKVGLKVGFYYSAPDWHFHRDHMSFGYGSKGTPESPHLGTKHQRVDLPKQPEDFADKYLDYVNGQITELMTCYGKIDILWFDGGAGSTARSAMLSQEAIRKLQPDIIINDRAHGHGDFHAGPECELPTNRPSGCWEYCGGLTSCWGYRSNEENLNPRSVAVSLLNRLAVCRAWGGNVLANSGPRPSGEMPKSYYGVMEILKSWMASRRESVYDVQAGPYPERANVPVTVRGKKWYLHLLPAGANAKDDPGVLQGDGPLVLKGVEKPKSVVMLGSGESLDSQFDAGTLSIRVPQTLRTRLVDVVKVKW
jgi:alpha-L-fucosidase